MSAPLRDDPLAISVEAFEAMARTLPVGSVGFENRTNEREEKLIWLDRAVVDRLRSLRGADESYSDVILRVTATDGKGAVMLAARCHPTR